VTPPPPPSVGGGGDEEERQRDLVDLIGTASPHAEAARSEAARRDEAWTRSRRRESGDRAASREAQAAGRGTSQEQAAVSPLSPVSSSLRQRVGLSEAQARKASTGELLNIRSTLAMELVWVRQAIALRKEVGCEGPGRTLNFVPSMAQIHTPGRCTSPASLSSTLPLSTRSWRPRPRKDEGLETAPFCTALVTSFTLFLSRHGRLKHQAAGRFAPHV
jgi:hypothetical protein